MPLEQQYMELPLPDYALTRLRRTPDNCACFG